MPITDTFCYRHCRLIYMTTKTAHNVSSPATAVLTKTTEFLAALASALGLVHEILQLLKT